MKIIISRVVSAGEIFAGAVSSILTSPIAFYIVATCLLAYVGWSLTVLRTWSTLDYWEHLAVIGAYSRNLISPDNPYTGPGNLTHLFTPYHLFWGAICRLTGMHPVLLTPVIGIVNAGLFILASTVLAKHILRNRHLSLIVLITFLFFWFHPWKWSGFYNFGLLPTTSVYPYWCAFPIALIVLSLFMEPSYRRVLRIIILSLVSAVVFLIHPLSGIFLYSVLVIKLLFLKDCEVLQRTQALALLAISGLIVFLWPYFPVLGAILSSPFERNYYLYYLKLPMRLAPMLLALPSLIYSAVKKQYDFIFVSLIFFGALFIVNFKVMQIAPLARLITYIMLILHIFTVRTFQLSASRNIGSIWIILFLVIFSLFSPMQIQQSFSKLVIDPKGTIISNGVDLNTLDAGHNLQIKQRFEELSPWIGIDDVVVADVIESWILPAIIGCKVVSVAHSNPFMKDYRERKAAGKAFFAGNMSASDANELISHYGVSHILLKPSQRGLVDNISLPVTEVWSDRGYILFRVDY
jgi:hypothetical protein